jgi:adenine-specific DNA-methyltransferase
MQGYTNAKGEKVEGLSGNNLRYYKSEFVGREPSVKNKRKLPASLLNSFALKKTFTQSKIN